MPKIKLIPFLANFSPFSGCSDFLSFMDYKLNDVAISPKELYDGLPQNIQGLSACIELCVLANDFNCLVSWKGKGD
uniref:Candidate secreted effector n=2 Tax=Meloidogyne TaxID=189290 RepID=A0A914MEN1_MELIC